MIWCGVSVMAVVKKYSSRCVPVATATSHRPPLEPLHARPTVGTGLSLRWGIVQVDVLAELADQRPPRLAHRESRQGMRVEATVAGKHEFPLGKPAQQHTRQLPHQVTGRLVTMAPFLVLLGRTVQRTQHRQGPRAIQSRQRDLNRQHDPFVATSPDRVRVRGPDRIPMPSLPIDVLPRMLSNRIIANERDRTLRYEPIHHVLGQNSRQSPRPPAAFRQHAVFTRPMGLGQRTGDSQQPTNRMSAHAQDRSEHQHQEPRRDRSAEFIGPFPKDVAHTHR